MLVIQVPIQKEETVVCFALIILCVFVLQCCSVSLVMLDFLQSLLRCFVNDRKQILQDKHVVTLEKEFVLLRARVACWIVSAVPAFFTGLVKMLN